MSIRSTSSRGLSIRDVYAYGSALEQTRSLAQDASGELSTDAYRSMVRLASQTAEVKAQARRITAALRRVKASHPIETSIWHELDATMTAVRLGDFKVARRHLALAYGLLGSL